MRERERHLWCANSIRTCHTITFWGLLNLAQLPWLKGGAAPGAEGGAEPAFSLQEVTLGAQKHEASSAEGFPEPTNAAGSENKTGFSHVICPHHERLIKECAHAACSHNVDPTAAQWLMQLALLGRNNALLLAPLAGNVYISKEGGGALIQDVVKNVLCQCVYLELDCLATTGTLWATARSFDSLQSIERWVTGWRLMEGTMHKGTQWHTYRKVDTCSTHWTIFHALTGFFSTDIKVNLCKFGQSEWDLCSVLLTYLFCTSPVVYSYATTSICCSSKDQYNT